MTEVSITIDKGQLARVKKLLDVAGDEIRPYMAGALNRAAEQMLTEGAAGIVREYNVTEEVVRKTMHLRLAYPSVLTASVVSRGNAISLAHFLTGLKTVTKIRPAGGLTVEVKRGQQKQLPKAFLVRIREGDPAIFERVSDKRMPIKKLFTTDVPGMFTTDVPGMFNNPVIAAEIQGRAQARIDRDMDDYLTTVEARVGG